MARPVEFDAETVRKLEEAFSIDATVEEACFYADISRQSYYDHVKAKPELFDRFTALRQRPVLKARQTLVKSLDNPDHAKWYIERKKKAEFSTRSEHTGADGEQLLPSAAIIPLLQRQDAEILEHYRALQSGGSPDTPVDSSEQHQERKG